MVHLVAALMIQAEQKASKLFGTAAKVIHYAVCWIFQEAH